MDSVENEVRKILASHVGKDNAITSQEISDRLGGLDHLDSTPGTRSVILTLIEKYDIPVGSHSGGYFIINSNVGLKITERQLEQRAERIRDRKDAVKQAVERNGYGYNGEENLTVERQSTLSDND